MSLNSRQQQGISYMEREEEGVREREREGVGRQVSRQAYLK
jgi:hypothetical protein